MRGAAGHFGEKVSIEQSQCMHHGAAKCVFHVRFEPQ
jgi:predicted hydrocarbon binding protein